MTCYMIFYEVHPILNQIIRGMNKVQLFRSVICLVTLLLVVFAALSYIDNHNKKK